MITLFSILKSLEINEDSHLGRIIVLLYIFHGNNGEMIEGLTKLAKLDFLLRYPHYLEKALKTHGKYYGNLNIEPYEKRSVEAKMVRFKYGPWDFRYRKFLNILISKGLVFIKISGKSYHIGLTDKGVEISKLILEEPSYLDIANRATIIKRHFNYTGTHLMRFIYSTFPEIGTLQYGKEIV